MRTIIGNIKTVFNVEYANKQIVFILCNKYNQPILKPINTLLPLKIETKTDENSSFNIELYETNSSKINIHYLMKFENDSDLLSIKLYVPNGTKEIQFNNICTPKADLSSFYYLNENGKYIFNKETIVLMDRFFIHEKCFTTGKEDELCCEFVKYADGLIHSNDMQALDELLGNEIALLSPTYSAIKKVVGNDIHKINNLIESLGNLDDMNKRTQLMIRDNQIQMQDAIKKATLQSIIFS